MILRGAVLSERRVHLENAPAAREPALAFAPRPPVRKPQVVGPSDVQEKFGSQRAGQSHAFHEDVPDFAASGFR